MALILWLVFNSILLGFGLAMDAFSVSLANGFAERSMTGRRMITISGVYACFQFVMPVIGWVLVHFAVTFYGGFSKFIPYISLVLLSYIGIKLIIEGVRSKKCKMEGKCEDCPNSDCDIRGTIGKEKISNREIFMQGVATSIDALSVGFTIEGLDFLMVILSALIIGAVTHVVCFLGLKIGTKFGTRFSGNAKIIGGIILVGIGIEICIKGLI
ncbi:MAG: manganese efflux pump [Butyrivibrio sp.]|nr:manganese efflux pump [Butyrivibrio sp.]